MKFATKYHHVLTTELGRITDIPGYDKGDGSKIVGPRNIDVDHGIKYKAAGSWSPMVV